MEHISVKNMNLEQLVSFMEHTDEWCLIEFEMSALNKEGFINAIYSYYGKESQESTNSYEYAIELISQTYPYNYPFNKNEYVSDVSAFLDEQQSKGLDKYGIVHYLPLVKYDRSFCFYRPRKEEEEGITLINCMFYPELLRFVYQVTKYCPICEVERIHTLRLSIDEYKTIVNREENFVKEARELIETGETLHRNKKRTKDTLSRRLRIPETNNSYLPKTLVGKKIEVTFLDAITLNVLSNSQGVIKEIISVPVYKETYYAQDGTPTHIEEDTYQIVLIVEDLEFNGISVIGLTDKLPMNEDMDENINDMWDVYLEAEGMQKVDKIGNKPPTFMFLMPYSYHLKEPNSGVKAVIRVLDVNELTLSN